MDFNMTFMKATRIVDLHERIYLPLEWMKKSEKWDVLGDNKPFTTLKINENFKFKINQYIWTDFQVNHEKSEQGT